jgi:hypothetical protein
MSIEVKMCQHGFNQKYNVKRLWKRHVIASVRRGFPFSSFPSPRCGGAQCCNSNHHSCFLSSVSSGKTPFGLELLARVKTLHTAQWKHPDYFHEGSVWEIFTLLLNIPDTIKSYQPEHIRVLLNIPARVYILSS